MLSALFFAAGVITVFVGLGAGALSRGMFRNMPVWVRDEIYPNGENFQKYHARVFNSADGG